MIIVSITSPGLRNALSQLRRSVRYADMIEFRLDLIGAVHLPLLLKACRKPTVVTCRPRWEGGAYAGSELRRIGVLRKALDLGASYVDIEFASIADAPDMVGKWNVILSAHFFDRKPPDVQSLYRRMRATGIGVLKFAYRAADAYENNHAFSFLAEASRDNQKAVAIAMGEAGEASRILYRKFGGWATYASAEEGREAAPGQVSARVMREVYRSQGLSRTTRVFAVIGNPVRQSKGIYVHNTLFRHDRLNCVYVRFPVLNLRKFMEEIAPRLNGFSVTVPHKEKVMRYLDHLTAGARYIRAANTVLVKGKQFTGDNTDAAGALDAIEIHTAVRGRKMLVVGAGGAARAITYEAMRRGADVTVTNRTQWKARALARATRSHVIAIPEIPTIRFDIMVNTTSVGMVPDVDRSPLVRSMVTAPVVFDVVYNPPVTRFLRDAKKNGAVTIPGTEMYINQAARQYALYTRKRPAIALMRRTMRGGA